MIKRRGFEHEQEARLLFHDVHRLFLGSELFTFSIDPEKLFDIIILDPRLTEKEMLLAIDRIHAAGCKALPLEKSPLYRDPKYVFDLL